MTPNEIRIAMAELEPQNKWIVVRAIHGFPTALLVDITLFRREGWDTPTDTDNVSECRIKEVHDSIPNYASDLNAVRSALMRQSKQFRLKFETLMDNFLAGEGKLWCEAEAIDYATIFLQAKRETK